MNSLYVSSQKDGTVKVPMWPQQQGSVYCVGEEGVLVMPDTAVFWAVFVMWFGRVEFGHYIFFYRAAVISLLHCCLVAASTYFLR